MDTVEVVLPTHWASALVNNDWSGLEPEEAERVRGWLRDNPDLSVVSCDGDSYVSLFRGLLTECSTYTCFVFNPDNKVDVPQRLERGEDRFDHRKEIVLPRHWEKALTEGDLSGLDPEEAKGVRRLLKEMESAGIRVLYRMEGQLHVVEGDEFDDLSLAFLGDGGTGTDVFRLRRGEYVCALKNPDADVLCVSLPSHWYPAMSSGDFSGLEPEEAKAARETFDYIGARAVCAYGRFEDDLIGPRCEHSLFIFVRNPENSPRPVLDEDNTDDMTFRT